MSSTTEQSNQSPGETHALTPSPPRDSGGRPSNDGLGSSEEDSDHEFEGYDLNRYGLYINCIHNARKTRTTRRTSQSTTIATAVSNRSTSNSNFEELN